MKSFSLITTLGVVVLAFASSTAQGAPIRGISSLSVASPMISPWGYKHTLAQQSRVHPREVGPGCTQVSVSPNIQALLGGSPPYSAEVAVTSSHTTVNVGDIDAHGCDFGIYVATGVSGINITNNTIHDADQIGVLVDGGTFVNMTANVVSQTGNHVSGTFSPNGVQTGLGVLYDAGSGVIKNNEIDQYQKNGITLLDGSNVGLNGNFVIGLATPGQPTSFIAQNGIEVIGSNLTQVLGNTAVYNDYLFPSYGATGFLICNATLNGTTITKLPQIQPKKKPQKNIAEHNNINYFISPSPSC